MNSLPFAERSPLVARMSEAICGVTCEVNPDIASLTRATFASIRLRYNHGFGRGFGKKHLDQRLPVLQGETLVQRAFVTEFAARHRERYRINNGAGDRGTGA